MSRSSFYYTPKGETEINLALMRRIDGQFLETPFFGVRQMAWHTCKVLAWRISNTLEADFCIGALDEAVHKFGPPEIMNADQGSQFTSFA